MRRMIESNVSISFNPTPKASARKSLCPRMIYLAADSYENQKSSAVLFNQFNGRVTGQVRRI